MPLVLAIFEVLARPAEDNDQAAALEKQMLRRSYFSFIQTVTGSGMNEVMANQGELLTQGVFVVSCGGFSYSLSLEFVDVELAECLAAVFFFQEQKT